MRKIEKVFRPIPEDLRRCFEEKQANLLEKQENHQFDSVCYSASIKTLLKNLYHNKCAFCETRLNDIPNHDYQFTVEHFRPKKGGYFWLGYEWSNLMPSCKKCNSKKGDQFPLPDKRKKQGLPLIGENQEIDQDRCVANCAELLAENAHLLHPEVENPMDFLVFDLEKLGYFEENNEQIRAKQTIDLCQLNRSELWERRKMIYDTFLTEIRDQLIQLIEIYGKEYTEKELQLGFFRIFKNMYKGAADEKTEYCSFRLFLFENFDSLFLAKMPTPEMQEILKKAFLLFVRINPRLYAQ